MPVWCSRHWIWSRRSIRILDRRWRTKTRKAGGGASAADLTRKCAEDHDRGGGVETEAEEKRTGASDAGTARLFWGAGPDRWIRPRLVRGAWGTLHDTGL